MEKGDLVAIIATLIIAMAATAESVWGTGGSVTPILIAVPAWAILFIMTAYTIYAWRKKKKTKARP